MREGKEPAEQSERASLASEGQRGLGLSVVGGDITLRWEAIQHSLWGREDKVRMVSDINTFIDLEEGGMSEFLSCGSMFTVIFPKSMEESGEGLN